MERLLLTCRYSGCLEFLSGERYSETRKVVCELNAIRHLPGLIIRTERLRLSRSGEERVGEASARRAPRKIGGFGAER